ncbi:TolA protein [Idiomarina sp. A28L]|uniref:cell envelope integrity protein TolA n=1 Tax=Idiomarina sp. A28L TaxID=1036674 RepID=UPI0002138D51|nr:cell envelope integrity protein TolA [Idiomarina sp. A28L]EGN74654.1 TolA protein [Idiomarina sp. A28L]
MAKATGKTLGKRFSNGINKDLPWRPIGFSVLLHFVLGTAIVVSMDYTPTLPEVREQPTLESSADDSQAAPPQEIVNAVAVDQAQLEAQVQRIQDQRAAAQRAEEQRIADLERRAREAEQQRQREEQRARQVAAEREQAAEQTRRAREQAQQAERERAEAEQQRQQAAERLRQQQEAEQRAAAERQRLEEERRAQEQAARERAERERQLQERLEREQAERNRARQQRVLTEVERYQALIRSAVQRNWIVDSSMRGQSCVLTISLARDGFVTNVQVGEGDRAVCESARAAVLRAGNLPVSDDADVYEQLRNFRLRVEPQFN